MKNPISRLSLASMFLLLTAVALFAQTPPAGSPVARHGTLRVEGDQIVNQHGQPVQLRGMSLYWSLTSSARTFYNRQTVQHLRSDWNADVVRAAMAVERNFAAAADQQGFISRPDDNRNLVLDVVAGAREAGMYVIIDWHSYIAEINQEAAVGFFRDMAQRFKDVPNVIFEIYNEPNGTNGVPNNGGGPAIPSNRTTPWNPTIMNYMQAVTDAIRNEGANNLILIGTPNWCQNPEIATAPGSAITGTNLVYTAHFYSGQADIAHRGALRNRILTAMDRGFPVFISEFGLTDASGAGTINTVEGDRWFDFLRFYNIGWANWALSAHGQTSAALTPGSTGENPAGWNLSSSGTHIRNRLRAGESQNPTMPFHVLTVNIEGLGEDVVHSVNIRTVDAATNNAAFATPTATLSTNRRVIDPNTTVQLSAIPQWSNPASWRFVRWEGTGLTGRLDSTGISFQMTANRTVTAVFERVVSVMSPAAAARAGFWSVSSSGRGLILSGPSAAVVSLYDMRGRLVDSRRYDGGGQAIRIGRADMPAGNYMVVARDLATGREVYRNRVLMYK